MFPIHRIELEATEKFTPGFPIHYECLRNNSDPKVSFQNSFEARSNWVSFEQGILRTIACKTELGAAQGIRRVYRVPFSICLPAFSLLLFAL